MELEERDFHRFMKREKLPPEILIESHADDAAVSAL